MLFFIGGAARTGKGILVRRLLSEMRWPYLSLDVLKMGLARGVPEFAIDPDAGGREVALRLWPLVREMSHNLLAEGMNYVIEGEVVPQSVAALQEIYPGCIKACFLGYIHLTPAQKLEEVRRHSGFPNDWPHSCSDLELLDILASQIDFSQHLTSECNTYGFRYFDTSHHFMQTLDEVAAYLKSE